MASIRNYLTQAELAQFADISITNTAEADDKISQAEEIIDSYVGHQERFLQYVIEGKVSAGGSTTQFTLDTRHISSYPYTDYFAGMMVEILGGTNAGERRRITGSSSSGVITAEAFTSAFDTTSVYHIFQIGKFPRKKDMFFNSYETPNKFYRHIPEAVKRATAAQVEYMIEMGDKFFATDASEKTAESIGDYSYSKKEATAGANKLIAPKARMLLKGITNRTGTIS
jgi:hypothetical protein